MLKIRRFKKIANNNLILESQESKSISASKKLWVDCGYEQDKYDKYLNALRDAIPTLKSKDGGKFILGCFRLFINNQLSTHKNLTTLNSILRIIVSSHIEEYDRNLNGMSLRELKNKFGKDIQINIETIKKQISELKFDKKSPYKIVRIDSFEDAKEYHKYTDWCITYKEDMWDNYTMDGTNVFYFMLLPGFKNVERKEGERCPNDKYGLSMVAVSVCPDGSLNSSTNRWNHSNGATDYQYDYIMLSKMCQKNFFEVFKPKVEQEDNKKNSDIEFVEKELFGKKVDDLNFGN